MLIASLFFSFVFLAVLTLGYRGGGGGIVAAAVALLGSFFFVGQVYFPGLVLVAEYLALIGGAIYCLSAKARPARYFLTGLALTAAIHIAAALLFIPTHREHLAIAAQTPVVDVSHRLAYEAASPEAVEPSAISHGPGSAWLAIHQRSQLYRRVGETRVEGDEGSSERNWEREWQRSRRIASLLALSRVHRGFVAEFIEAPGFGSVRMGRPSLRVEDLPLAEPSPLELPAAPPPQPPQGSSASVGPADFVAGRPGDGERMVIVEHIPTPPSRDRLNGAHLRGVLDFVNEAGFGYVEARDKVLGFQAHGFREPPAAGLSQDGTRWQVVQLELVSLLKHRPPAAYVSKHLPRMDELRDAPTRPLDGFERDALERLRGGEELVAETAPAEVRMLGPLRAFEECRQCHQVKANALLGAFTYRLEPVNGGGVPRKPRPRAQGETL